MLSYDMVNKVFFSLIEEPFSEQFLK